MRLRGKVDNNQPEIVKALRKCGVSVQSLANIGSGCVDLLTGYMHVNRLLEVKQEGANLTPKETDWHRRWNGQLCVVRTVEEALIVHGIETRATSESLAVKLAGKMDGEGDKFVVRSSHNGIKKFRKP